MGTLAADCRSMRQQIAGTFQLLWHIADILSSCTSSTDIYLEQKLEQTVSTNCKHCYDIGMAQWWWNTDPHPSASKKNLHHSSQEQTPEQLSQPMSGNFYLGYWSLDLQPMHIWFSLISLHYDLCQALIKMHCAVRIWQACHFYWIHTQTHLYFYPRQD